MKLLRQKIQQQISNSFSIFHSPIFCGFENVYWNNEQIQKYSQLFLFYERYHENHCVRSIPETEHLPISSILTKYLQLMECSQLTSAGSLIQEVCASFHEHFYHPDDVKELLALICAILKEKAAGTEEPAKMLCCRRPFPFRTRLRIRRIFFSTASCPHCWQILKTANRTSCIRSKKTCIPITPS